MRLQIGLQIISIRVHLAQLFKMQQCPLPVAVVVLLVSVPARLGKGQGAKEIGHNLAREQPKFGHNLVRKQHKIGHTFTRERLVKTWAQICKHFTSIFTSAV